VLLLLQLLLQLLLLLLLLLLQLLLERLRLLLRPRLLFVLDCLDFVTPSPELSPSLSLASKSLSLRGDSCPLALIGVCAQPDKQPKHTSSKHTSSMLIKFWVGSEKSQNNQLPMQLDSALTRPPPVPTPKEMSVRAAQGAIARSLHNALDNLCTGPLASSAGVAENPDIDVATIDELIALCNREVSKTATDEAGGDLPMDEANAALSSRMGDDWRVMISRQNGKPFYHNALTGATAWERPDALTADRLGLELDPEALSLSQGRGEFRDGVTLLEAVRSALAALPPHSDRVDVARVVGSGLSGVAEAVDAVVVAKADPGAAEPFTAAAVAAVEACGKIVAEPEVAWLLQDPSSEVRSTSTIIIATLPWSSYSRQKPPLCFFTCAVAENLSLSLCVRARHRSRPRSHSSSRCWRWPRPRLGRALRPLPTTAPSGSAAADRTVAVAATAAAAATAATATGRARSAASAGTSWRPRRRSPRRRCRPWRRSRPRRRRRGSGSGEPRARAPRGPPPPSRRRRRPTRPRRWRGTCAAWPARRRPCGRATGRPLSAWRGRSARPWRSPTGVTKRRTPPTHIDTQTRPATQTHLDPDPHTCPRPTLPHTHTHIPLEVNPIIYCTGTSPTWLAPHVRYIHFPGVFRAHPLACSLAPKRMQGTAPGSGPSTTSWPSRSALRFGTSAARRGRRAWWRRATRRRSSYGSALTRTWVP